MIVECPACHSRYRIESAGIVDDSTFFECCQKECRGVFPYSPPLRGRADNAVLPLAPPPASLTKRIVHGTDKP